MHLDYSQKGFMELDKALRELGPRVQSRVMQQAANAGMREARKAIKKSAPVGEDPRSKQSEKYGRLKDNIGRPKRARNKDKSTKSSYVGIGNSFWGFFLEYGTRYIPATRWFSKAFESAKGEILENARKKLGDGIEKEFGKMVKK